MPAWKHSLESGWDAATIRAYRFYVGIVAPNHRGDTEDCADLSMKFLSSSRLVTAWECR